MIKNNAIILFSKAIVYNIALCVIVPLASTLILFHMCQRLDINDITYWYLDVFKDTILFLFSGYLVRSLAIRKTEFLDNLLPSLLFMMWFIFAALLYFTNSLNSSFGEPNLYTFFPLYAFIPLYTIGWFFHRRIEKVLQDTHR